MSLFVACLVTAILLLIEHIALWRQPWRLEPPAAYILGVATLGAGAVIYGALEGRWEAAIVFWALAIAGGFADVAAYWVRSRLAILDAHSFQAGQVAGLENADGPAHAGPRADHPGD